MHLLNEHENFAFTVLRILQYVPAFNIIFCNFVNCFTINFLQLCEKFDLATHYITAFTVIQMA